jgi:hypothetical protein
MSMRYLYFMPWLKNLDTPRRDSSPLSLGTLFAPVSCRRDGAGLATTLREAIHSCICADRKLAPRELSGSSADV